jgi:hypothetical protein
MVEEFIDTLLYVICVAMERTDTHGSTGGGQQHCVGAASFLALQQYDAQQACFEPSVKAAKYTQRSKQAMQVQLQKIIQHSCNVCCGSLSQLMISSLATCRP